MLKDDAKKDLLPTAGKGEENKKLSRISYLRKC